MTITPVSSLPTTSLIYQTALLALSAGISCVPIIANGSKQPAVKWKRYQQQPPSRSEVRRWFFQTDYGLAFIMGKVSGNQEGNLELLDFDTREIYEQFSCRVQAQGLARLLQRIEQGYSERSPQGVHLYYRCAVIEGNKKLAERPLPDPPYRQSLIETRGEGGYCIAAPSCGGVHPSGQPYEVLAGSPQSIATISAEARAFLFSVARALDEMPPPEEPPPPPHRRQARMQRGTRLPGHIFNERATWAQVLEPHGWTLVKQSRNVGYWRRPGKTIGLSATTNFDGSDRFFVFSTSTSLEPRIRFDKFGVYARLVHHGDFSAASQALAQQGYEEKSV